MPELSVVIPMYNPGPYFVPFMESLLQQGPLDWEIIIVNDGSTDGSERIAADYARRHPFIRIHSQPNQGVSIANNTGLQLATGRYLAMPDSDDLLYPGMYRTLLAIIRTQNLDVVQCNGEYEWENRGNAKTMIFPHQRLRSTPVMSGVEWLNLALKSRKYLHVVMLALFRREFLLEHGLTHFEPGLHHQDIPWMTEVMYNAKRVQYIDQPFYLYRVHGKSVSHNTHTDERRINSIRHYMRITELLDELNQKYRDRIPQYPVFKWQITKEAIGIYFCARGTETAAARQQICQELFARQLDKIMWRNAVGLKQKWRLFRYLRRARQWAGLANSNDAVIAEK